MARLLDIARSVPIPTRSAAPVAATTSHRDCAPATEATEVSALAPFRELVAAAERGELTRQMIASGMDHIALELGRRTADPDSTSYAAARDVRAIVGDTERAAMPLWQAVVRDRLGTLKAIAGALCDQEDGTA